MARFGDRGPYATGNVKFITKEQNSAERKWSRKMLREQSARMRGNHLKAGHPWSAKQKAIVLALVKIRPRSSSGQFL